MGVNQRRLNSFSSRSGVYVLEAFKLVPLSSTCTRPLPLFPLMPFRKFVLFTRNAVSERLNSRAINCSHLSSLSSGKTSTAAGLPLYARSVNASICQFIIIFHIYEFERPVVSQSHFLHSFSVKKKKQYNRTHASNFMKTQEYFY